MKRSLLLMLGFYSVQFCYGQKIQRIETKLITTDIEATDEVYSSIDFDENGKIIRVKEPKARGIMRAGLTENQPFALLNLDLGNALYPLALESDWVNNYQTSLLDECQNHADCQFDMITELDRVVSITTTRVEMIEEVFDKFSDPNSKVPSTIVSNYRMAYYPNGLVQQLKFEQKEGGVTTTSTIEQFAYGDHAELEQYIIMDLNKERRIKLSFKREGGPVITVEKCSWNLKKGKWQQSSEVSLNYAQEGSRLNAVTYFDDKGREQYIQEFIYSYY